MKNREIFIRVTWSVLRRSELPAVDDLVVPWNLISKRAENLITGYSCLSTACVLRYFYEKDLGIDSSKLQFKAVVDENDNLWHVWLEHDGRIVDTEPFKKMYKRMYSLGEKNIKFETEYHSLKSEPFYGYESLLEAVRSEFPNESRQ